MSQAMTKSSLNARLDALDARSARERRNAQRAHGLVRPSRRHPRSHRQRGDMPFEGDWHPLDGRGWWQPWMATLLLFSVPAMIKLIPGRPWWEFFPAFTVVCIGLAVGYHGWKVGNPLQKTASLGVVLVLLALGLKLVDWTLGAHVHTGPMMQMDSSYQM